MKTLQFIYPAILTIISISLTTIIFIVAVNGLIHDSTSLVSKLF